MPYATQEARALSPWQVAANIFDPPADPHRHDPVSFARDILGFQPWSHQRLVMEAVDRHPRVAWRSCHGVGKTATAARVALWFLATRRNSRVITTAPTWAQVEQLLWRQIRAAVTQAHDRAQLARMVPSTTKLELDDEWFAIGLSTNEPERFQGHHADHLLLIVDEASGVAESIFEAAEGFLTADGARMLLIGNPTRIGGQFHRAFTTERGQWHLLHTSVDDTPNYTGERVAPDVARALPAAGWKESRALAWGVTSPMFEVRVKGDFPSQASNAVISLGAVEDAQARVLPADPAVDLVRVSCDVARYGDDETVIGVKVGPQLRIVDHYRGHPTTHTAGRILEIARGFAAPAVSIVIDDAGVGGGVTDMVRERLAADPMWRDVPVTAFNGGEQALQPDLYPNRRSELWFAMAERIGELDLDGDDQLAADLTSPTYRLDSSGRRVVEAKAETKKRLGRSPDRADMALMALVAPRPRAASAPSSGPVDLEAAGLPPLDDGPVVGSLTGDLRGMDW